MWHIFIEKCVRHCVWQGRLRPQHNDRRIILLSLEMVQQQK